jgi:hypothetical protein
VRWADFDAVNVFRAPVAFSASSGGERTAEEPSTPVELAAPPRTGGRFQLLIGASECWFGSSCHLRYGFPPCNFGTEQTINLIHR